MPIQNVFFILFKCLFFSLARSAMEWINHILQQMTQEYCCRSCFGRLNCWRFKDSRTFLSLYYEKSLFNIMGGIYLLMLGFNFSRYQRELSLWIEMVRFVFVHVPKHIIICIIPRFLPCTAADKMYIAQYKYYLCLFKPSRI